MTKQCNEVPRYSNVYSENQQTPYPAAQPPMIGGPVSQLCPQGAPMYPPQQERVVGVYPTPQGHYPYLPQHHHTVVITQGARVAGSGECRACNVGNFVENFTCCGIVLAIICFPLGLLCCLFMTEKRCTHCAASFSTMVNPTSVLFKPAGRSGRSGAPGGAVEGGGDD